MIKGHGIFKKEMLNWRLDEAMDRLNVVETDIYRKVETEIKEILTKYPGKYLMFKILKEYLIISN